jgi:pimeloyl-ACP methyl ester carboxylesterase
MQEEREQISSWAWQGAAIDVGLSIRGEGRTVLMLPAMSSISTRHEMAPLQTRLARRFRTVTTDWPGFGDLPRPPLDWRPPAYAAYLDHVLSEMAPKPYAVIAAGHAASYVLAHACERPATFERLVLLAPTWRGPLPTMMNGRRPFFDRLCHLFDVPMLGPFLYGLNVNRMVVRYMAAGHVYSDPAWLDRERLEQKLAVTRASGARYASVRFVTGALDPLPNRDAFLDRARRTQIPILTVYGESPAFRCTAVSSRFMRSFPMRRRPPCCLSSTDRKAAPRRSRLGNGGFHNRRLNLFSARCAFFAINKLILCWKR